MNLADIPSGELVFVDANIFLYYFEPDPVFGPACEQLFLRVEQHELVAFSSSHVISDLAHRLMTTEAHTVLGWPFAGMALRLKKHPDQLQKLTRYRQAIDEISLIGVQILPVTGRLVSLAADSSRTFGLLTNDALVVSVMQDRHFVHLASNDADFDRVPGITRYAPA
jgi:predicted nucleic acid-binding protein